MKSRSSWSLFRNSLSIVYSGNSWNRNLNASAATHCNAANPWVEAKQAPTALTYPWSYSTSSILNKMWRMPQKLVSNLYKNGCWLHGIVFSTWSHSNLSQIVRVWPVLFSSFVEFVTERRCALCLAPCYFLIDVLHKSCFDFTWVVLTGMLDIATHHITMHHSSVESVFSYFSATYKSLSFCGYIYHPPSFWDGNILFVKASKRI